CHQQTGRAATLQHCGKLPPEVEAVLDGHVHPLSGFRTVGVRCIAGDEYPWDSGLPFLDGHIVETLRDPLSDLVDGPSCELFDVEPVRVEYPLRCFDNGIDGETAPCLWGGRLEFAEIDIESDQVPAFSGNEQSASVGRGLDDRLASDVGEVGDGENVHHAPRVIHLVTGHADPEGSAHRSSRAIASD